MRFCVRIVTNLVLLTYIVYLPLLSIIAKHLAATRSATHTFSLDKRDAKQCLTCTLILLVIPLKSDSGLNFQI